MTTPIHYCIICADPGAHLFKVTLTVAVPDPAGCRLSLPAWIPGSYMIREFARNIVRIDAHCKRQPVTLTKLDKHTWQAAPCAGPLVVEYEVYAWDLSVRAAHLDETHAFFNGTSVFLAAAGHEKARHTVELVRPSGRAFSSWRVATTLPRGRGTARYGFGTYEAPGYDALIDHPVEMGTFSLIEFKVDGIPHAIAITGRHDCDLPRLAADLEKVCAAQILLFHGPRGGRSADMPFSEYLFLVLAVGDGYGGLEHRSSTALICSRADLPHAGLKGTSDGYRTFLGLCSHEYFHSWNVKRMRPAAFSPYDLTQENYTRLLWGFEGITSYYDDLMLVRTGLITLPEYLDTLARTVRGVLRGAGRTKQSVGDSSFDAWVKYYRQDENAPNAIVSYYTKGSLVALCLDLLIRSETGGHASLDDVMRQLWRHYGAPNLGVPEDGIEQAALAVVPASARRKVRAFLREAVDGVNDLPLRSLLQGAGYEMRVKPGAAHGIGARTAASVDGVKLTHVLDGGGAQVAGLSAGDVVIAADGLKASQQTFEKMLARKSIGDTVDVHAFRRDELLRRTVRIDAGELEVRIAPLAQR